MPLDKSDFIIHSVKRKKPRYDGEVNCEKRYAAYCDSCGALRGYIKISHYNKRCKNKLCKKCISKDENFKNKVSTSLKQFFKQNPPIVDEKLKHNRRIAGNLRNRLIQALKGNYKAGSAVSDLGCSIDELKTHLESKFQPGMSWDNYGRYGWHIDHIVPLSSFDLVDVASFKKACHYTNLQPLWAKDNIVKGNKN